MGARETADIPVKITMRLRKFDGDTTEGEPVEEIVSEETVSLSSLPKQLQDQLREQVDAADKRIP